ncbi:hypothetical protein BH09BAC6_BH09BAC6_25270 [soil metagenome]|jgi:hypothetical protein
MATIPVPENLAGLLDSAINTVIQSPAVQSLQWAMCAGCQPSTLNNMYFCDAASVSGKVVIIPHADSTGAHVDTNDHVDTNNHVDTKMVHDDAHWDVWGTPQSHTDNVPHDDTSTAHDDTSLPHDDTSAHFDTPASDLNYSAGLTQLQGCGSLFVSNLVIPPVSIPAPPPDAEYTFAFSCDCSFNTSLTAKAFCSVNYLGIPFNENVSLTITGVTGTMAGEITLYCTGNSAGEAPGYYATVTNITIALPTNISSYSWFNSLCDALSAIGIPTSWVDDAFEPILTELTGLVNGIIANEVEDAINSVLDDELILSCDC